MVNGPYNKCVLPGLNCRTPDLVHSFLQRSPSIMVPRLGRAVTSDQLAMVCRESHGALARGATERAIISGIKAAEIFRKGSRCPVQRFYRRKAAFGVSFYQTISQKRRHIVS
jgi:hypothetical protein